MSCYGCTQEATEKDRAFDTIIKLAKQQAIEQKKPKAVCEDQISGLFIADAAEAVQQCLRIRDIVSFL